MIYIYESHMGGLYETTEELDVDALYCETCHDNDMLLWYGENVNDLKDFLIEETYYEKEYIDKFVKNLEDGSNDN